MATHSSILAWRYPWIGVPGTYSPWSRKELDMTEPLTLSLSDAKYSSNALDILQIEGSLRIGID